MFTRRHFLAATALTSVAALTRSGRSTHAAGFETPLPIPQLIDAKANANAVSLTIGQGVHAYRPGQPVQSFGYSAPVLGPVIRLVRGESTDITIGNKMSRPSTVHWHGLNIPGAVDGGPHNTLAAGQSWKASLKVDQPESPPGFIHTRTEKPRSKFIPDLPVCSSWRTEVASVWAYPAATVSMICRSCCRTASSIAAVRRSTNQVQWTSWPAIAVTPLSSTVRSRQLRKCRRGWCGCGC